MLGTQRYDNPFIGLRPFNSDESHLFFGREGQTDELVNRLQHNRFLAVVGTSGSGKSSLVRAGLLPALYGGFMVGASSVWQVAVMRPGNTPISNLAAALHHPDVFSIDPEYADIQPLVTETTLRLSSLGLIEVVQRADLPPETNLLIVVDQFEELFRFKEQVQTDEATNESAAFVNLLLEATENREISVYVVLTMRSDFLGECAQFRALPEAINDSQYLIPRMTRDELRSAVVGPISVSGGKITPRLVNQLLNDVSDNPDQLPVLQHALLRTWNYWKEHHSVNNPIDLPHYLAVGGMERALSDHADEVYKSLDDCGQAITEILFKQLTEKGTDNRGFRRPTLLGDVCVVAEATPEEVFSVVEQFRQPGRSFLMPLEPETLRPNTVLDISHESLMRIWKTLEEWVEEEAQSATIYRRLAETAALHEAGRAELLQGAELEVDLEWFEHNILNQAWAGRYDPNYNHAIQFLERSRNARDALATKSEQQRQAALEQKQKDNQRLTFFLAIATGLAAIATGLALFSFFQYREARKGQLSAFSSSSDAYFASNQQLEALMESLRAGEQLKQLQRLGIDSDTQLRVLSVLRQRVYDVRERNRLEGYTNWVSDVNFSPDGQMIVTGCRDGTIKLWNRNGSEIKQFPGHTKYVSSVQFDPDGQTFASASWDGTIKLWSREGQLLKEFKSAKGIKAHTKPVKRVSFSPDGHTIASASDDKTIKLWNVQTGGELRSLEGHKDGINSVRFSHDGKELISAGKDGTIRRWRSQDGVQLRAFSVKQKNSSQPLEIEDATLSPDGKRIASASQDKGNPLKLWDLNGNELKNLSGHSDVVGRVEFSPDGKTLASASWDGTIKLWNLAGNELETFKGHQGRVYSVSYSPDRHTIASASEDRTVKLWSLDVSSLVTVFRGHKEAVNRVSFSPDGQTIASASDDKTVKLWSRDGTLQNTLQHTDMVTDVSFSPNGRTIASASQDKTIKLWGTDGKLRATLSGHTDRVNSVSFSPDGQTLASGSTDGKIGLWSVKAGTFSPLKGSKSSVMSVSVSPDGQAIASGSSDKAVRLWRRNGKEWQLQVIGLHGDDVTSVSFSPDGRTIASGSADTTIKLWNRDGSSSKTLSQHKDYVHSVRFSADGRILISASADQTIKLWDVQNERELNRFKTPFGDVQDASFDFADHTVISAHQDGTLILWYLDLDSLLKLGCSEIRDYLNLHKSEQTVCRTGKK